MIVYPAFAEDTRMHIHGHDFIVLGLGYGSFDSNQTSDLKFNNPPHGDVGMMPASG